jgi:hypothetical protein
VKGGGESGRGRRAGQGREGALFALTLLLFCCCWRTIYVHTTLNSTCFGLTHPPPACCCCSCRPTTRPPRRWLTRGCMLTTCAPTWWVGCGRGAGGWGGVEEGGGGWGGVEEGGAGGVQEGGGGVKEGGGGRAHGWAQ